MTAVLSATGDDKYLFFLPISVWSWNQIGVRCLIFHPARLNGDPRFELAKKNCRGDTIFAAFTCAPEAEVTYAQMSRLFGAALPVLPHDEILITADIDMLVFGDYFKQKSDYIDIFGADLMQGQEQYPMCYISMTQELWWYVMRMGTYSYQQLLDFALWKELVNHDMRGNLWSRDQELIYQMIRMSELPVQTYSRRNAAGFASNRVDRDDANWQLSVIGAFDYHLHRPGYNLQNFENILWVLQKWYPHAPQLWLLEYRNSYLKFMP